MTQVYKLLPMDGLVQSALQHGKAEKPKSRKKQPKGGKQKLSDDDVRMIRKLANGRNSDKLAAMFGVCRGTINQIVGGRTRVKHIL